MMLWRERNDIYDFYYGYIIYMHKTKMECVRILLIGQMANIKRKLCINDHCNDFFFFFFCDLSFMLVSTADHMLCVFFYVFFSSKCLLMNSQSVITYLTLLIFLFY